MTSGLRLTGPPERKAGKTPSSYDEYLRKAVENASAVHNHLMVFSGKGGVGKSFLSASISYFLSRRGLKVLLYDADETGSSIPFLLGALDAEVLVSQRTGRILPPSKFSSYYFLSIEHLLPEPRVPLLWEGALRSRFLIETLSLLPLENFDVVVYDLPPGTGDELITLSQILPSKKGLVISSPGRLAERVVRKAIVFAMKFGVEVIGLIENMSYYKCPNGNIISLFGESSLDKLMMDYGIKYGSRLPFETGIREAIDKGKLIEVLEEKNELTLKLGEITDYIYSVLTQR